MNKPEYFDSCDETLWQEAGGVCFSTSLTRGFGGCVKCRGKSALTHGFNRFNFADTFSLKREIDRLVYELYGLTRNIQ